MESTIFTLNVINQINEFVESTLYEGLISGFDIRDAEEFDEVIEAAENGQTEFELNVDLEQMADPDVFERLLSRFMDNYVFDQEYRYMTKVVIKYDADARNLEVSATFVLGRWTGLVPTLEPFVSYNGKVIELTEYVELKNDVILDDLEDQEYYNQLDLARADFTNADQFDWNSTAKSTIISLEKIKESEKSICRNSMQKIG